MLGNNARQKARGRCRTPLLPPSTPSLPPHRAASPTNMYFVEMMLLSMAEQQLPPQEERANDSSSIVDDVVAGWPELEAAREFQTQLFSREVGRL